MLFSGIKLSDLSKVSILLIAAGFVLVGGALFFFAELAEDVLEQDQFFMDQAAQDFFGAIRSPWLDTAWGGWTELGSVWFLTTATVLVLGYFLFFSKFSRWVAVFFLVNMAGISLLTKALKLTFERERPEVLAQYDGTGFSFPSGHSTGSMVFYGFMIYVVVISRLQRKWKVTLGLLLGLVILLVGFSRVYVGVHYLTDITAGFLFGLAWLLVCIAALEVTLWNQRRRQQGYKMSSGGNKKMEE
ncbi:UNVERIFIED_CONTAM: phosphatase PAP2 family protein [Halobacillus marinus]|uniref:phosphatase PAP2 family protein n=1 Tax=Bacillus sp. SB49 TaxID=1071080 RepID=UPI00040FE680|nr:phosphatase PAP2 family protein [Bacillus sp. SB49]QHT45825.1 phosphatase PAP2 family protein [Bacillus sp. SB49]